MLTIRKNIIPMGTLKHFSLPDKAAEHRPFTPQLLEVYESIQAKLPHLIVEQYATNNYGGKYAEAIGVRDVGSKCYTAIIFHVIGGDYRDGVGNGYTKPQCFVVASPRYQTDRAVLDARHGYIYSSRRFTAYEAAVKEVARLRPISLVEILGSAYDDIQNEVSDFMDREDITKNALYKNFVNEVKQKDKDSFLLAALKTMMEGQVLCLSDVPKALMQAYVKYTTDVTDATGVINKDTNQYHVLVAAFKDGDIVCAYYPQKDYRLQGWKNPEMVKYKKVEDMPYAIQLKLNTLEITIQPHPDPNSYVGQQSQEIGGVGVKINDIPVIPECYLIGVANETINELSQNVKG